MRFPLLPAFGYLAVAALGGVAPGAFAKVALAPLFADHAILQRDQVLPVWGTAAIGEKISVTFGRESHDVVTGSNGTWRVWFDPRPASAIGTRLVVKGENVLVVSDVLVGEVWFCSGQSNMTFPVARSDGAPAEIASADLPLLRQFTVAQTAADEPAGSVKGGWRICSPETAGRFTAVGFYFGRELLQDLKVPIGLIQCAWGGTAIESWIAPAVLAARPEFQVVAQRWRDDLAAWPANQAAYNAILDPWLAGEARAGTAGEPSRQAYLAAHPRPTLPANLRASSRPGSLYNGMVYPIIPYAMRGFIWYQGESNTGHPEEYRALFTALIDSWRATFGQGDLPFYWVSLASYKGDRTGLSTARLREAQAQALSLPHTGQALAIDLGNPNDIHPTNKREVGHRLALIARARAYGLPGECSGPELLDATVGDGVIRVRLSHAEGLHPRGDAPHALEVADGDRKFYPASGTIAGETLLVSSPDVKNPVAVRYAFSNAPDANLYNGAGLPAAPFRTDDW